MTIIRLVKYVTIIIITCALSQSISGQDDNERPLSPELTLISVDPLTSYTGLQWTASPSSDVAGYVMYMYSNGEGEAFDTIFDPNANSYTHQKQYAGFYSVSYVIAAIDSSGNTSPLSNYLSTIYTDSKLDTCNHQIELKWNSYTAYEAEVMSYRVMLKGAGIIFTELGSTLPTDTTFSYSPPETGQSYCFAIEAICSDGNASASNMSCSNTDIPSPPAWINANYADYGPDNILSLSFSYDPASQLHHFRLDSATNPSGPFYHVKDIENYSGLIETEAGSYRNTTVYYRLAAINNCNQPVRWSNLTTSFGPHTVEENNGVVIKWPEYREYNGILEEYTLYRLNGGQPYEAVYISSPGDTSFTDNYDLFAYNMVDDSVCYFIEAREDLNPFTENGISRSAVSCLPAPLNIFVPNAFTPDGDGLNDEFFPVMSFTPSYFRMAIKTRTGLTVFESGNILERWDGKAAGKPLKPDVYLWFIELQTPGGRKISRHGTVTIIFN